MKKIISLTMTVIMCLTFGACSSKASNISVTAFENKLNYAGLWNFEIEEKNSNYEIKGKSDFGEEGLIAEFNGKADSNKMVYSAEIKYSGIAAEKLGDEAKLLEMLDSVVEDYSKITESEAWSIACVLDYEKICYLCSGTEIAVEDAISNIANGKKYKANGWVIKVKVNSSAETCTINVEYKG